MNDRNGKYIGTPKNHFKTPVSVKRKYEKSAKRVLSDSDESVTSNSETDLLSLNGNGNVGELSLVAEFDDLMRVLKYRTDGVVEEGFFNFLQQMQKVHLQWDMATKECQRLRIELDKHLHDISDLETKLTTARKFLDQEKKIRHRIEEERDVYVEQLEQVRDVLMKDRISDSAQEKLKFLNIKRRTVDMNHSPLHTIHEGNTTGSLLSDFSCSMSLSGDDILDAVTSNVKQMWKPHRPSMDGVVEEPAAKKRRSSGNRIVEIKDTETVRATTTLTLSKKGPITATSVIESIPPPKDQGDKEKTLHAPSAVPPQTQDNQIFNIWQSVNSPQINKCMNAIEKQHTFQTKIIVIPEVCGYCEKRIRFAKSALRCENCRAVCHPECKNNLPLPCVPNTNTPNLRGATGVIGDYTPTTSPMVPAIVIHCLKEIECRGLKELGIYRIPGSEKDVKSLKEKFLKGRGAPCLNQLDVHVICGTVKDFLRSLNEPLVTYKFWPEFVKAAECNNEQDIAPALYQLITELPQPNRDTLAYMVLHLKRVAEAKECKMPILNLAKVFGPTIVGYSSGDPDPSNLMTETRQQVIVMEHLLNLPVDYWRGFINMDQRIIVPKLQQTPSTDSLLAPTKTLFTPKTKASNLKRKKLPTPTYL